MNRSAQRVVRISSNRTEVPAGNSRLKLVPPVAKQDRRQILSQLERELGQLAYNWRTTRDDTLVDQYQSVLRRMVRLGFKGYLDADAELPDELMPQEYLVLFD